MSPQPRRSVADARNPDGLTPSGLADEAFAKFAKEEPRTMLWESGRIGLPILQRIPAAGVRFQSVLREAAGFAKDGRSRGGFPPGAGSTPGHTDAVRNGVSASVRLPRRSVSLGHARDRYPSPLSALGAAPLGSAWREALWFRDEFVVVAGMRCTHTRESAMSVWKRTRIVSRQGTPSPPMAGRVVHR